MDKVVNVPLLLHPVNWLIVLLVLAIGGAIMSQITGHFGNAAQSIPD